MNFLATVLNDSLIRMRYGLLCPEEVDADKYDMGMIVINGKDVEVLDSNKYLGCVIDNKLKFDIHVREQILKKPIEDYIS